MTIAKTLRHAERALLDFDERSKRRFEPYRDSPAMVPVDLFSKLGDQPELRLIAGALMVGGIIAGSDRMVRAAARMIIAHEAATALKDVVKFNVDRTRPRSAGGRREVKVRAGKHRSKEKTSFPSGHTAGAIATASAFAREYPEYRAAALAGSALVAAAQVPRSAHYPTDIAAGAMVGLAAEALVDMAWNAARMDERSET